jgi:C4-type Zn-finger protein
MGLMEKKTEKQNQTEASASIRLEGGAISGNAIPATVLAQTITGLQQLVFLMGADSEEIDINERLKFSNQHRDEFTLMCEPPSAGSFVQNLRLKNEKVQSVFKDVIGLMAATAADNHEDAKKLIKNPIIRRRAFQQMATVMPKEDDGVSVAFFHAGRSAAISGKDQKTLTKWIQAASTESAATTMTVKGVLVAADFENRRVKIKYRPTNKEISCKYLPEIEDRLLDARKVSSGLIEVTGEFTLDNKGFPLKLTNVFRIEPVSLGSIKLPELRWKNRTFKFNQPMEFTPSLDAETQQLYVIEDASLGVNVFSETREGLLQELSEQIAMLWDEYADEKDENLAEDALAVAKKLRHAIKVSGNA